LQGSCDEKYPPILLLIFLKNQPMTFGGNYDELKAKKEKNMKKKKKIQRGSKKMGIEQLK
jgi:hypothetical protein